MEVIAENLPPAWDGGQGALGRPAPAPRLDTAAEVGPNRLLIQVQSGHPLEVIERCLCDALAARDFSLITSHDLRQTLKRKELELGMECRVYVVCNAGQAKRALEADAALAALLPCRIAVHGSNGRYTLVTLRPSEMVRELGSVAVAMAEEVEDVLVAVMRAAA